MLELLVSIAHGNVMKGRSFTVPKNTKVIMMHSLQLLYFKEKAFLDALFNNAFETYYDLIYFLYFQHDLCYSFSIFHEGSKAPTLSLNYGRESYILGSIKQRTEWTNNIMEFNGKTTDVPIEMIDEMNATNENQIDLYEESTTSKELVKKYLKEFRVFILFSCLANPSSVDEAMMQDFNETYEYVKSAKTSSFISSFISCISGAPVLSSPDELPAAFDHNHEYTHVMKMLFKLLSKKYLENKVNSVPQEYHKLTDNGETKISLFSCNQLTKSHMEELHDNFWDCFGTEGDDPICGDDELVLYVSKGKQILSSVTIKFVLHDYGNYFFISNVCTKHTVTKMGYATLVIKHFLAVVSHIWSANINDMVPFIVLNVPDLSLVPFFSSLKFMTHEMAYSMDKGNLHMIESDGLNFDPYFMFLSVEPRLMVKY